MFIDLTESTTLTPQEYWVKYHELIKACDNEFYYPPTGATYHCLEMEENRPKLKMVPEDERCRGSKLVFAAEMVRSNMLRWMHDYDESEYVVGLGGKEGRLGPEEIAKRLEDARWEAFKMFSYVGERPVMIDRVMSLIPHMVTDDNQLWFEESELARVLPCLIYHQGPQTDDLPVDFTPAIDAPDGLDVVQEPEETTA